VTDGSKFQGTVYVYLGNTFVECKLLWWGGAKNFLVFGLTAITTESLDVEC
jgi:hypothetical protein